jgi:hypothetical protein
LKATVDAFWNHCPLIVTELPTGPLVGLKPLIVGVFAGGAEKLDAGKPNTAPSATTKTRPKTLSLSLRDDLDFADATVSCSPPYRPLATRLVLTPWDAPPWRSANDRTTPSESLEVGLGGAANP